MSATPTEAASLLRGRLLMVLAGAGCSTDSGIPDYRSPGSPPRNPIQYKPFVTDEGVRRRYWARSFAGWSRFGVARPNAAHASLAEAERRELLSGLVTQNVDGLHQQAGSRDVVELHGALGEVICLSCHAVSGRDRMQSRLAELNPALEAVGFAPDGDAEVEEARLASFRVPACEACGGVLKPRVVFFGENVPKPTVDAAFERLERAEGLLVVGSSLTVFSGFRFVRRAAERGIPIAIFNDGPTRGDPLASIKVEERLGSALPALIDLL